MRRSLLAITIIFAAAPARAEGPITVAVGGGLTQMQWEEDDDIARFTASLHVDLGVRVHPIFAPGLHAGLSLGTSATEFVFLGASGSHSQSIRYTPIEVGIGGTVTLGDRAWLAPWVGIVDIQTENDPYYQRPRKFGFGADVGFDLRAWGGQRVAMFGGFTYTDSDDPYNDGHSYLAMTFGAAYRYW